MPKTYIKSNTKNLNVNKKSDFSLHVSECFGETIQGEGKWSGFPSTFLRLKGCTLSCNWCDTLEVWKDGDEYDPEEIFSMWEYENNIENFKNGHHLVITGGSPLKQDFSLAVFVGKFISKYGFKPYIEVENECVLFPNSVNGIAKYVDCWNNSPKLSNSGMSKKARYKPEVLEFFKWSHVTFGNYNTDRIWKFVVSTQNDWDEIVEDFIKPGYVSKNDIYLMPEGATREEISSKYNWLVDLACKEGVRVSDRLHVTIWNKKTGV
jgi:organic radical activating enzyme